LPPLRKYLISVLYTQCVELRKDYLQWVPSAVSPSPHGNTEKPVIAGLDEICRVEKNVIE